MNITRGGDLYAIDEIRPILEADSTLKHYSFDGVQTEITMSYNMVSNTGNTHLFGIIFYEDMYCDLIKAVLSPQNVIDGMTICPDSIDEHSIGVIMTLDALHKLGYSTDNMPAFIDCHLPGADSLGFEVLSREEKTGTTFVRAPIPLLSVVKRLPMNKEMLASKYLENQFAGGAFDMNNEDYARKLRFFVPKTVQDFIEETIKQSVPDSLKESVYVNYAQERIQRRLLSWCDGQIVTVDIGYPGTPLSIINGVERDIKRRFSEQGVQRVYNYEETNRHDGRSYDDVISVHFTRLDSIRAFEQFIKETSDSRLHIEMTQVNSKENFNAVSIMAIILSVAMIVFSIVCIVIFLTYMLQSYFQKVRSNLGTFKAFGISTRELIGVYVTIIVCIVLIALIIALAATWGIELLLLLLGVTKDGGFSHLILWNPMTLWTIAIILFCTIVSVLIVMQRLLHQTPGNLIYNR